MARNRDAQWCAARSSSPEDRKVNTVTGPSEDAARAYAGGQPRSITSVGEGLATDAPPCPDPGLLLVGLGETQAHRLELGEDLGRDVGVLGHLGAH